MRQTDRRPVGAGLLVVGALALIVVVVLAVRSGSAGDRRAASDGDSGTAATAAPEQGGTVGFAALRSAPVSVPHAVVTTMGPPAHGIDWGHAHRLPISGAGRFWAARGNDSRGDVYLCIAILTPARTTGRVCTTEEVARTRGLAAVFIRTPTAPWFGIPGTRLIIGIAPDHARAVLTRTRGHHSLIPVRRGGIFVKADHEHDPPDDTTVIRQP